MEQPHDSSPSVISKGRLEFLFDGIFAIAMTILVLELKVPELVDRRSMGELAHELAHHAPTFVSYLLSFVMLGVFWYRHNHQYHHFHKITEGMLVLHFVQLAAAAFFPFCAALVGRYHSNLLSIVIYLGCVLVYTWAMFANWIMARKSGALGAEVTAADYLRIRSKGLRGCLIISILFAGVVIEALVCR
jgi:uncharacterized membrane protein